MHPGSPIKKLGFQMKLELFVLTMNYVEITVNEACQLLTYRPKSRLHAKPLLADCLHVATGWQKRERTSRRMNKAEG